MNYMVRVPAIGRPEVVEFQGRWQDLARTIGCTYIELVHSSVPGVIMVVDEEGALKDEVLLNMNATGFLYPGNIYGDALLMTEGFNDEGEIDFMGLPEIESNALVAALRRVVGA